MACLHCTLVVKVLGTVSLDKPWTFALQSVTLCLLARVLCHPLCSNKTEVLVTPASSHQTHQGSESGLGLAVPTGSPSGDNKSWHALICKDLLPKHTPSACWLLLSRLALNHVCHCSTQTLNSFPRCPSLEGPEG